MRFITFAALLFMLTACDERSSLTRNGLVTVKGAAALEDKIDATERDKHKIYICAEREDTYKGFQDCLKRRI
jgi:hypothetical protein